MATTSNVPHLLELFGFLTDPQAPVRRIALANLLPFTAGGPTEKNLFQQGKHLEDIAKLCADEELIAHDALSALINLTSSAVVAARLGNVEGFLAGLVRMIIDEKALLADLACMLLSNMTKVDSISIQLLHLRVPITLSSEQTIATAVATTSRKAATDDLEALDLLLEVFLVGEGKKYNSNANYDFLASVFANVSTIQPGRAYLLSTPSPELEPPLVKLISFTEHPSTIRRGGVASSIKNSAFDKSAHTRLISPTNGTKPPPGSIDLLPQMLLPLCGPEEFDIDDLDALPEELQLLPPDKVREPDSAIRLILVETLLLLATMRICREALRARGVYPVIKVAHLAETVSKVTEPIVRLVDLLMRDEGPETAIEEVEEPEAPVSSTILVDADGKEVHSDTPVAPSAAQIMAVKKKLPEEEEDEEDMLIEVL